MVDHRTALCAAALALLVSGCTVDDADGRLIDRLCDPALADYPQVSGSATCEISGDAFKTTGMTDNSLGYRLGPGGGALRVRLNALEAPWDPTWSLDVLAAAAPDHSELLRRTLTWGSCGPACPDDPEDWGAILPDNYNWVPVVAALPGLGFNGSIPADAYLELSGKNIHIVDLRVTYGIRPD